MTHTKKLMAYIMIAALLLGAIPLAGKAEAAGKTPQSTGMPDITPGEESTPPDTAETAPPTEAAAEITAPVPDGAAFETALPMTLNQPARGRITQELPGVYFILSAAQDGDYTFRSEGGLSVKAELMKADGSRIAAFAPSGDAGNGEPERFLATARLLRSEIYYLYAQSAVPGMTGAFTLTFTRDEATAAPETPAPEAALPTPETPERTDAAVQATDKPAAPASRDPAGILISSGASQHAPEIAAGAKGIAPYPESEHPYADGMSNKWYYQEPDAVGYLLTFSSDTYTESGCDLIRFFDDNSNPIQFTDEYGYTYDSFTGSQLSGQSLMLEHKGFYLELTSDSSVTAYGFRFTSIIPYYAESTVASIYTCEQTGLGSARVTYNKVTGATGYRLYRAASQFGTYACVGSTLENYMVAGGLSAGRTYWFKVRPYVIMNKGTSYLGYSDAASVTILSKPVITSAALYGANTALIQWKAVPGAKGYILYRSGSLAGAYTAVADIETTYCYDGSLIANIPYYYKVIAYRVYSQTVYSAMSGASRMVKYEVPVITYVCQSGTETTRIVWAAMSASGYEVYRSAGSGGAYSLIKCLTGTGMTDYGLAAGEIYSYRIRAYKTSGGVRTYSEYSSSVSIQILTAPAIQSVECASASSALITWNAVGGAAGYSLYRASSENGVYALIAQTTGTSLYDTGVTTGTYYYKVAAYVRYGSAKVYSGKSKAAPVTITIALVPGVTYRALVVGNADYWYENDLEMDHSANNMGIMLERLSMNGSGFSVTRRYNRTGPQIIADIQSAFSGADDNDVSLFYYGGHGVIGTDSYSGSLCGVDSSLVLPSQLRNALNAVPGTVVVLLDSCSSGAYIKSGKGQAIPAEAAADADAVSFNSAVISAFYGITARTGELLTSKFMVITSCAYNTVGYAWYDGNGYGAGFFGEALCLAGGWNLRTHASTTLRGDTNADAMVTLQEAYVYSRNFCKNINDSASDIPANAMSVQVYPANSAFMLYHR
jgi:hypothetical protein